MNFWSGLAVGCLCMLVELLVVISVMRRKGNNPTDAVPDEQWQKDDPKPSSSRRTMWGD